MKSIETKDSSVDNLGNNLCPRCRNLDLERFFDLQSTVDIEEHRFYDSRVEKFSCLPLLEGTLVHTFESVLDLVQDPNCKLCQAFDHANPVTLPQTSRLELRALHKNEVLYEEDRSKYPFDMCFAIRTQLQDEHNEASRRIWLDPQFYPSWWGFGTGSILPIEVSKLDENQLPGLHQIGDTVPFADIKRWMNVCRANHSDTCEADRLSVEGMRLINCYTMELVVAPPVIPQYAALSYLWGSEPFDWQPSAQYWATHGRHALPNSLPKTIEDAIKVTKRLEFGYIWIDRYCIPQLDEQQKFLQIKSMNRIYEAAEVTIIAAVGNGPNHGLPGVTTTGRLSPARFQLGSHVILSTPPDPRARIDSSTWSTRAWTFQEGHLSRRRLVFTEHQVYFQCHASAWCESKDLAGSDSHQFDSKSINCPYFDDGWGDSRVYDRLREYSKRTMSDPDDVLNAFLGILEQYRSEKESLMSLNWHLWGLPIFLPNYDQDITWERAFVSALWWFNIGPSTRRKMFPSWSWTGWSDISKPYPVVQGVQLDENFQVASFSIERTDGTSISISDCEAEPGMGHDPTQIMRFLQFEGVVIPLELRSRDPQPSVSESSFSRSVEGDWPHLNNVYWQVAVKCGGEKEIYEFDLTEWIPGDADFSTSGNYPRFLGLVLDADSESRYHDGKDLGKLATGEDRSKTAAIIIVVERGDFVERIGVFKLERHHLWLADRSNRKLRFG